jgi:hypothetical protein
MKSVFSSVFILAFVAVVFQAFEDGPGTGTKRRRDGTDPGHTGSPGDNFKNCTICHGGTATDADGWITSNIPSTGWKPGQIYTITATNTKVGSTRFGFQVSPQDMQGNLLGQLIVSDTGATQLVGDSKYITYKSAGVDGTDLRTWTFNWQAPGDSINEVVFYGAFNSNHEGHKAFDNTTLSKLTVRREGAPVSVDMVNKVDGLNIVQNYTTKIMRLQFENTTGEDFSISIYTSNGVLVKELYSGNDLNLDLNYDFSQLSTGIYMVNLLSKGKTNVYKVSCF